MYSLLLVIIYIAFISLGLPDSILGSAWPSMYDELNVPVSYAGIITMIISAGTIVSSINSDKFISRFGTGVVTAVSVAMTALALLGFSVSGSFYMLCLWGIPYGLGAGSVDAALNNFVALHYKSRHMSWLHCFWGIGASVGPYIMGFCLTRNLTWNTGYRVIGVFQVVLSAILFSTLFMWKGTSSGVKSSETKSSEDSGEDKRIEDISGAKRSVDKNSEDSGEAKSSLDKSSIDECGAESEVNRKKGMKLSQILKIRGVKNVLVAFFCYCAVEATTGLWASSYMVIHKGIDSQVAAKWASLFYLGITAGRFICGFISDKFGDRNMVRIGEGICVFGILVLFIPAGNIFSLIGLIMVGLGCAPIYPSIIHATPDNFGADKSQAVIGVQMACAYVGTTLMPPLFGLIANHINISIYPFYLLIIAVCMIVMSERLNRAVGQATYAD